MGPKVVRSTVLTTEEAAVVAFRKHTLLKPSLTASTPCSPTTASSSAMPSSITPGPTARYCIHMFDRVCLEHGIERRFTKPDHP
ncbi:MAG: hypothetical protein BGO82_12940 [Devosia sp. 67-54]|nr:hypothetical protein [Devosia sp.]OJX15549.1 MAG: hypothetical protein BGO82_12940 [Devosia sp. 67-54]